MPTLDWIGKEKVVNHHLDVPFHVLERRYSYDESGQHAEDNGSENMIIHGDNLLALKSLLPQYEGRIKCIYIDPPYNTGNEKWVYNDNVNDPRIKKWLGEVVGTEGEDLSRHDKWLCMMYPRLKLLHKLLADDGAIFISIDYHEQSNLKQICDEVFGSNNYIAEVACVNSPKGRDKSKNADMATAHECITIYRKSSAFKMWGFTPEEKITKRYNKIEASSGRRYRLIDLRKTGNSDERVDRPNLFYPFFYNCDTSELLVGSNEDETPKGFIRIEPMKSKSIEGRWCWERDTAIADIDYLTAVYQPVKQQWSVFQIDYLDERDRVIPTTAWTFKDVNSERGTELFQKKLGFAKNDFPNPKPVGTIERIISISTKPTDIILDSFAGSATTANAVLNINKREGSQRRFILIEMMDYSDTITAERTKRVIKGTEYKEEEILFDEKITLKNLTAGDDLLLSALAIADDDEIQNQYEVINKPEIDENGHLIVTGLRRDTTIHGGTGGDFSYYELGEPLMIGDNLNEDVGIDRIREYVYFTETKQRVETDNGEELYYLGTHFSSAYYFYYERESVTTLNRDFLHTIKTKAEAYVIYADLCTLSEKELGKYHITFKKIPRDITKL